MPSAMDKKTGLNLGYAVFAALAVLLVRGEGNSGSPPAFYTLGAVSVGLQIGGHVVFVHTL